MMLLLRSARGAAHLSKSLRFPFALIGRAPRSILWRTASALPNTLFALPIPHLNSITRCTLPDA